MSFECEYCFNVYNLKYHLSRHQNSDSCKKIQNIIIDFNDKINKINEKLKENDNEECKFLKNRIKMLENKVLKKQPREKIKENKNTVYIVTTEHKEENGHYKIGKSQNLQNRMSVYNTTDKHKVVYSTSCKIKEKMDILEKLVHDKLESIRIEPNKEWFESKDKANDIIKIIEELKKVVD